MLPLLLPPLTFPIFPPLLPLSFSSFLSTVPMHIQIHTLKKNHFSRLPVIFPTVTLFAPTSCFVFGRHLKKNSEDINLTMSMWQFGQHISKCHRGVSPLHHNCSSFLRVDSDAHTGQGLEWAYFQILITSGIRMSNSIFLWGRGEEEGEREGRVMLNLAI